MEGFTKFKKVQCFKEGGAVQREVKNFTKRERKTVDSDDIAQDKKVVKKAFSIHDTQQHEEKTDLSKLKNGGRAKKAVGTVKKFEKASGEYGAKKDAQDKKNIKEAKQFKPVKLCGGKSVKKMADGGMTGPAAAGLPAAAPSGALSAVDAKLAAMEKQRQMEKMKRAQQLGPAQQSELINQSPAAAGLTPPAAPVMRKKGGKACK